MKRFSENWTKKQKNIFVIIFTALCLAFLWGMYNMSQESREQAKAEELHQETLKQLKSEKGVNIPDDIDWSQELKKDQ